MTRTLHTPNVAPVGTLSVAASSASGGSRQPARDAQPRALGEILRVASDRQLRALCAEILREDRGYPLVGLTCPAGTHDSTMPAERVREVIWPSVPIYVIEPREARAFGTVLSDRLGAYNGAARVWWPGVNPDSDPWVHPLIYDSTRIYGEDALRQLAAEFEIKSPQPVDLPPAQQAVVQKRLRVGSERRCRELEHQLRDLQGAHRKLQQRALPAERRAPPADPALPGVGAEEQDTQAPPAGKLEPSSPAERLYLLILEKWVGTFNHPHDRKTHPLASYFFSENFLRALDAPDDRAPL